MRALFSACLPRGALKQRYPLLWQLSAESFDTDGVSPLMRDFSLALEYTPRGHNKKEKKNQGFSRVVTRPAGRIRRYFKNVGRVGSGREVLVVSRVGSGRSSRDRRHACYDRGAESWYGSPPNFSFTKSPVSKPAPCRIS